MRQPEHNESEASSAAGLTAAARIVVLQPAPGHDDDLRALLGAAGETPEVLSADTAGAAVDIALQRPVDVAVLVAAADNTGSVLEDVAELEARCPELPLVVLSAVDDRELALSALRAGAQDVLARPGLQGRVLARALLHAIERSGADSELTRKALHDGLTGLPNRALLTDRLTQGLGRLSRSQTSLALLVLDLDGFKAVNDRYGHAAGDELLVEVARRISELLRTGDTAARFGGDEFVVLCEDVGSDHEAVTVAERIAESLAQPFAIGGGQLHVSASIGVSIARGPGVRAEVLLRDADSAMYRCKQRGVDYEVFDDVMRTRAARRLGLESELRRALEEGEFTLHYQPVVELTSGSIGSCEALLRWAHPSRGLLLPADFLEVAEDAGLMLGIGGWAIGSAARQAALWEMDRPEGSSITVSVNLSERQCLSEETVEAVEGAIRRAAVPPSSICLEFTEASVMADLTRAGRTLRGLKELGVLLAIDNFGTGQSSLRLLEQLPVDLVKIDRSFTAGMAESRQEAAIVAAVIGLTHAFGLRTVAEGVETLAQVDRLRALGCDGAQGHYFAPAQAPADLTGLVVALA